MAIFRRDKKMRLQDKLKQKYQKYKGRIKYNRDLLAGELFAFPAAAGTTQITSLATESMAAITVGAAVGDYIGYGLGYGVSSFAFNRGRYWNRERRRIKKEYWGDISKYLLSANLSVGMYYAVRGGLNYALLKQGMEPYQASIISQIPATAVWYASMNLLGNKFGIVHKDNKKNEN